jgi:hypothetical protein
MAFRNRIVFLLLWMVSLVVVGTLVSAQVRRESSPVISGGDIGFRPEGWNGRVRTGALVVRINGEWVDVVLTGAGKVIPAGTR